MADLDLATLLAAGVGAGVTAGAAWWRERRSLRTAARLIHAELATNAAPVAYFRAWRTWVDPGVRKTAWEEHGPELARRRRGEEFDTIRQGYAALEGIAFLARAASQDGAATGAQTDEILDAAIADFTAALKCASGLARTTSRDVSAIVSRLESPDRSTVAEGARSALMGVAGAIPGYVLIRAAAVGVAVSTGPLPADSSRNPLRRLILDATGVRRAKEGRPVRREGDPPVDDPAVNAVYDNLEICHRFLWDVFGRDSYDDQGAQLTAAVHYGDGLANAFWDGELMVFGDGDGEVFGDLAGALDIAALSVGRAINQFEAGLVYHGQDGAIVESFGDVVAALVVQYHENQTADQAHWLVGRVLGPKARGDALRSMKAPGTAYDSEVLGRDRQPAHMRDYVETEEDNGGVHINSGILNHAFYLVAISLGGRAWEQAGRIWYDAMCAAQATEIGFAGFAALTVAAATSRYGADGLEVAAVRDAWDVVGVDSGTPARGAG